LIFLASKMQIKAIAKTLPQRTLRDAVSDAFAWPENAMTA
jgi:hypothetical protein